MDKSSFSSLQTARLILRTFRDEDFPSYADYHSRSDVYRFLYASPPGKTALAAQFAERPDVRYGLTAMCVGLGQGGSVIWENPHYNGKKR